MLIETTNIVEVVIKGKVENHDCVQWYSGSCY